MKPSCNPWLDLSVDAAHLTCESGQVIGLRWMLAAKGGPDLQAEMIRMVSEKAQAAIDAHFVVAHSLLAGEAHLAPSRAVALYRDRVQANHRRLTQAA